MRIKALAKRGISRGQDALSVALYHIQQFRIPTAARTKTRLHVGCGKNSFPGWINADVHPRAEMVVFLERRLPFPDASLDRIYLEHVMEHVPYEVGVHFLKEAHRVLKPDGVVRIAMPDLEYIARGYLSGEWRNFEWVQWPAHRFIESGATMINICFRWWGHQHLYDREELARALAQAGFKQWEFQENGASHWEDLRELETRADSILIADAVR